MGLGIGVEVVAALLQLRNVDRYLLGHLTGSVSHGALFLVDAFVGRDLI